MFELRTLTITDQDERRLRDVAAYYVERESAAALSLLQEIERAVVVEAAEVGRAIVTMNSRVTCRTQTGKRRVVTLVYPRQADVRLGRVSVLAPLGRALLGAAVGDRVPVVAGAGMTSTWTVEDIIYQPEAAGDYHL